MIHGVFLPRAVLQMQIIIGFKWGDAEEKCFLQFTIQHFPLGVSCLVKVEGLQSRAHLGLLPISVPFRGFVGDEFPRTVRKEPVLPVRVAYPLSLLFHAPRPVTQCAFDLCCMES